MCLILNFCFFYGTTVWFRPWPPELCSSAWLTKSEDSRHEFFLQGQGHEPQAPTSDPKNQDISLTGSLLETSLAWVTLQAAVGVAFMFTDACKPTHPAKICLQYGGGIMKGWHLILAWTLLSSDSTILPKCDGAIQDSTTLWIGFYFEDHVQFAS